MKIEGLGVFVMFLGSDELEKEKNRLRKPWLTKLRKARKRLETFHMAHEEGMKWAQDAHIAELMQSNFYKIKKGMETIELEDWETGQIVTISLEPRVDPAKQLEKKFKQAQKKKRKQEATSKLIPITEEQIRDIQSQLTALDSVKTFEDLKPFEKSSPSRKDAPIKKEHPFREFTTKSGCKIYAGKSAKDNDKLTFSFARGSDTWLHASEVGGSHVILRSKKGEEIDEDALKDAAQIALYFSKAKNRGEGEVTYTECKYVKKPKRANVGQVTVSSFKRVYAVIDPSRINRLFAKLLPGQAHL